MKVRFYLLQDIIFQRRKFPNIKTIVVQVVPKNRTVKMCQSDNSQCELRSYLYLTNLYFLYRYVTINNVPRIVRNFSYKQQEKKTATKMYSTVNIQHLEPTYLFGDNAISF